MKRILIAAAVMLAGMAPLASVARAQTIPHVTGTFKTPEGKTPAQAGLKQIATIGATAVYGSVDFQPYDSAANKPTPIRCGGITYAPQPVRVWIRGDGTIIDGSGMAGTDLVPTAGCLPAGAVYRATIQLAGSADGRVAAMNWTEQKAVPSQATADWGTI